MRREVLITPFVILAFIQSTPSQAFGAEPGEFRSLFAKLLDSHGEAYVAARQQLCTGDGAVQFLKGMVADQGNWYGDAIAKACLAWIEQRQEIERVTTRQEVMSALMYFPYAGSNRLRQRRAIGIAANMLMRHSQGTIRDDALVAYLVERTLKNYRTDTWAGAVDEAKAAGWSGFTDDMAERMRDSEATMWCLLSMECLRRIRIPNLPKAMMLVAVRSSDPLVRAEACRVLASIRERGVRRPSAVSLGSMRPNGEFPIEGTGIAGHQGPVRSWETEAVKFTEGQVQAMWQTLLVVTQVDPSDEVRKAAAKSLGRSPRFVLAIPFLRTAIAEMPKGAVKTAAVRSLGFLEAARAAEAKE
jgi:hypothetical protein